MRVYVAGSSAEIDRAERAIAALRERGIEVTSTWPQNVRRVGAGNPRDAAQADRARWAKTCLAEVAGSTHFWFLAPSEPSFGAGVEFGTARCAQIRIISSGETTRSIFPALYREFSTDDEALEYLTSRESRTVRQ